MHSAFKLCSKSRNLQIFKDKFFGKEYAYIAILACKLVHLHLLAEAEEWERYRKDKERNRLERDEQDKQRQKDEERRRIAQEAQKRHLEVRCLLLLYPLL